MKILLLLAGLALAQTPPEGDGALPPRVGFDPAPLQGQESFIVVADEFGRLETGVTVQVIHRPGLDGERQMAIGISDTLGRVRWTPELAGVAVVRAGKLDAPVHVAWSAPPTSTLTLLGLLLLGALGALTFGLVPLRRRLDDNSGS